MTVLQSLEQFFWSGLDVLKAILQAFQPHLGLYLGLAVWIIFCTCAINWVRLRKILLAGGGVGLVLIALVAILVWGCIDPPDGGAHYILGAPLGNFFGKMVYVTGLVCIMMLCGSVQLALKPPQEVEAPAASPDSH